MEYEKYKLKQPTWYNKLNNTNSIKKNYTLSIIFLAKIFQ